MKIKIEKTNAAAIEAALLAVNGKATSHVYTSFSEIEKLAWETELQLLGLLGTKKSPVGAVTECTSGRPMAGAHSYARVATKITLERCASRWFLVDVKATTIYQEGGKDRLILTAAQDRAAVARLRSRYQIAAES